MAITALNSAATGLRALSTRIDVIANNLANAETTAFKRSRMNFEDLMYVTLKEPGSSNNQQRVSAYMRAGQTTRTRARHLKISHFIVPQGLRLMSGSLYVQTEASGPSVDSKPGEHGSGTILQGFLEGSSVGPVKELVT